MKGNKGEAADWIIWGIVLTLPMTAVGGLAGFIACWLFFGRMAYLSEKKYRLSGSYIGKQVSKGTYKGDRKGKLVTIDDYPELKKAVDEENYEEELIKEVAIRNAIAHLPPNKRAEPNCKLAVIKGIFPYMQGCGADSKGAYRIVTRRATQEEYERAKGNMGYISECIERMDKTVRTAIYY